MSAVGGKTEVVRADRDFRFWTHTGPSRMAVPDRSFDVAANSDGAAIGPFDQVGSPLYNEVFHRSPFGRIPEKADIHSDNP